MAAGGHEPVLAGRYALGERLGHGAMAEVFRALDLRLNRQVAVKLFAAELDPLDRSRGFGEARALARVSAPGLVAIYDVSVAANRPFLVMELVDGPSLRDRLESGPLSPAETARLGAPLADALAHVHARGIVHRDVKPSNILLGQDGTPRLADFGIALLAGDPRRTAADEIIGTPAYLSPEQISEDTVGPAADIYALGLVLLECLTGEVAFRRDSRMATALARLYHGPDIPHGLPRPLARLLTTMTATDPTARPTAAECAEALRANESTSALPLLDFVRPRRHWSRPAVLIATAAVALPVLVATLVLSLNGPRPAPTPPSDNGTHAIAGPLVDPHQTTSPAPPSTRPTQAPAPVLVGTGPQPPAAPADQLVTSVTPPQGASNGQSAGQQTGQQGASGGQPAHHDKGKNKGHQ
ncbi:MAG TPA: protein kinase [Pseudonocardiaceae bacterium]|jgi:serine/threonine protein kinase|nr:protein kinase [Pseudonocardiaceae bacterium]